MKSLQRNEEGAALGDRAAFEALFELYIDRVHAFALRRLGERAGAEAVCTEIMGRVVLGLEERDPQCSLDAWVFSIVRDAVARAARKQHEERLGGAQAEPA